jgi:hypothetical protein
MVSLRVCGTSVLKPQNGVRFLTRNPDNTVGLTNALSRGGTIDAFVAKPKNLLAASWYLQSQTSSTESVASKVETKAMAAKKKSKQKAGKQAPELIEVQKYQFISVENPELQFSLQKRTKEVESLGRKKNVELDSLEMTNDGVNDLELTGTNYSPKFLKELFIQDSPQLTAQLTRACPFASS